MAKVEKVQGWKALLSKFSGLIKVICILLIAFGIFKAYGLWQYHHPTPELAAMRQEKIMQYETDDLIKVYDYEDRGGKDYKGNYNGPTKHIELKSVNSRDYPVVHNELAKVAVSDGWVKSGESKNSTSFTKGSISLTISNFLSTKSTISVIARER